MLKKAGPFKYRKVKALPSDSNITNTRFYILTDRGNFWCPPFRTAWETYPEEMTQCLEINNVFAVRVDLGIATRCPLDKPVDIDIGETIAFRFNISLLSWKQPDSASGSTGNDGVRGPSGQYQPKIRFIYGQDGKLAVHGMAGIGRNADGKKRGHSLAELQRDSRPTGKTLPLRPENDKDADSGD